MTSLCITIPESTAKATSEAAKSLGVSRAEFIRQAIIHELSGFERRAEELKIIKSFSAMRGLKAYSKESENLMDSLPSDLPDEKDEWWNN